MNLKRRDFLGVAGGAALLPSVARGQQSAPLVGVMRVGARNVDQFADAFKRDMARLGWEEGKGYRTQFLWADDDASLLPAMAAELVKSGARVIVAFGNAGVAAAQAATNEVPIVGMANDLAGAGLVSSMARPGGNT